MTFALKRNNLPKYTVSDYEQWEGRWELIDGIPFAMSPLPNTKHQWINSNIIYELKSALKECNGCRAYMPIDWRISDDTVVQPDASVGMWRNNRTISPLSSYGDFRNYIALK
jgi:Uma2 family endonuclease